MGDRITISGDVNNSILNIKSTLTNVQQSVGALPASDEDARAQLESLIGQLSQALTSPKVQETKKEEADAVAASAQILVETAKAEKPNKTLLQSSGEVLKKAAENLAEVAPTVISIATQIVTAVLQMKGMA